MKIGIPKGLLYYKYYPFLERFLYELGADLIVSEDTNKAILDEGVRYCVDEACLPIKIFHGHVASIKDKCDIVVTPRIMRLKEREFICPKFCGLPEMIINSIPDMPKVTSTPIYANSPKMLYETMREMARSITSKNSKIDRAFEMALAEQRKYKVGIKDENYKLKVALLGHPYNVYDSFVNMNVVKKLNKLNIGIITEENIDEGLINNEVRSLFKRPFWTFARNSYGAASFLARTKGVDGIVYISSFACGIDSVVIDLIKHQLGEFPMLVLKVDEHTGEAGIDTRIEAFSDMLERRCENEDYLPSSR